MVLTRRSLSISAAGLVAAGTFWRAAEGQTVSQQDDGGGLRNRGAPTGRVGAATRGFKPGAGDQTLELVAPRTGIGLSSSDQPTLCYLLSGVPPGPLRFVMSLRNQPRPVADLELKPPGTPARLGVLHLRDHNIRLMAHEVYVWSVAVQLSAQAPSRDMVASALIQYRPIDLPQIGQAQVLRDYAVLEANGYWYDAAALAEASRGRDGGAALQQVLQAMGLGGPNAAG